MRRYPSSKVRSRGCILSEISIMTHSILGSPTWQWPRLPGCNGAVTAERSYPMPKARGGSREEQPHVQGAVAVWVQEGLEELLHV